jgi:hypothetical protein
VAGGGVELPGRAVHLTPPSVVPNVVDDDFWSESDGKFTIDVLLEVSRPPLSQLTPTEACERQSPSTVSNPTEWLAFSGISTGLSPSFSGCRPGFGANILTRESYSGACAWAARCAPLMKNLAAQPWRVANPVFTDSTESDGQ